MKNLRNAAGWCRLFHHILSTKVIRISRLQANGTCLNFSSLSFSPGLHSAAVPVRALTCSSSLLKKFTKSQNDAEMVNLNEGNIILLGPNKNILGEFTLSQAKDKSQEQDLKLVLIDDNTKSHVYQLMSSEQYAEEQKHLREQRKAIKKKDVKTLNISSKISNHDLEIKAKHVHQWLEKGLKVKVTIKNASQNQENNKSVNHIFKMISEYVSALATVHEAKRSSSELILQFHPVKTSLADHADHTPPLKHEDLKKAKQPKSNVESEP